MQIECKNEEKWYLLLFFFFFLWREEELSRYVADEFYIDEVASSL